MMDYCTLRPLVVRVQARMYLFWKFDILGFGGMTTMTTWQLDNTEKPGRGQPPLPGTKYLRQSIVASKE